MDLKDAAKNFVSASYEAPKKVSKPLDNIDKKDEVDTKLEESSNFPNKNTNTQLDRRKQQELEMKRARYDVIKFGISGFEAAKAKEAKVALAIKLGAKPPKKPSLNYKVLKVERKKEAAATKDNEQVSGLSQSMVKHKNRNKHKKNSGILGMYGKVHKGALVKKKK
ncbi:hypothetical protein KPH14_006891 [Odynerus spinipes]|uniref:Uncharacterized protein n=1 Tax=Odynerus spinipes TaxID=1348599 RepID=A0AAD9RRG7_9HYME|nr:hypothetical protein KPH14_006891 [Odynerus spinipes]